MYSLKKGAVCWLLFLTVLISCSEPLSFGQALVSKLTLNIAAFDSESSSTLKQLMRS